MKLIFLLNLICIFVATSKAATARGVFKDQNHPGKCVVRDTVFSPGEEAAYPSACGKMICNENSVVQIFTCGAEQPPPGFMLGDPIMPQEPYPNCCRKAFIPII